MVDNRMNVLPLGIPLPPAPSFLLPCFVSLFRRKRLTVQITSNELGCKTLPIAQERFFSFPHISQTPASADTCKKDKIWQPEERRRKNVVKGQLHHDENKSLLLALVKHFSVQIVGVSVGVCVVV